MYQTNFDENDKNQIYEKNLNNNNNNLNEINNILKFLLFLKENKN